MDLNSLSSGTNRIFKTSNDLWISFDHYASIMESPVPEDSFKRIYSTGHTESGQTVARVRDGQSASNMQNQLFKLGVPKPGAGPTVTATTTSNTDIENPISRAYAITYVTAFGEEGQPSEPTLIDVYTDQTVTITAGSAPASRNITTIRLYRTTKTGRSVSMVTFRNHQYH